MTSSASASEVAVFNPGVAWQDIARQHGTPLLVLDCDILRAQYRRLAAALPGVRLYYAIKALPHPDAVLALWAEGAGFDLASQGEIDMLRELGIGAADTIHTHPIKKDADIRGALAFGCRTFVVDNADEILKFRPYREQAELLLRLGFRSPEARCDLSRKFGCAPEEAESLLELAAGLQLRVKGLSFHVGSQASSPAAHVAAIECCGRLLEGQRRLGRPLSVLDIGGGFPANYDGSIPAIDLFCAPIREALERLPAGLALLAEPGRFLAAPAGFCLTSVVGKAKRGGRWWYYLDDGVYGGFSGQIYDHARYPLSLVSPRDGERQASVLAGPTCDSIDVIAEDLPLPALEIGDLLLATMAGAYTWASAGEFNSLPRLKVLALNALSPGLLPGTRNDPFAQIAQQG